MAPFDEIILVGGSLGYTGVLIVTLLISLIVFVPIPYIPVLIIALLSGRFDPNLLAFASAIGVTLGRTTIFLASYRGRSLIARYGSLGSFVASLTPFLPDDIITILLGISKFAPWKFVVTTFLGKFIINLAVVWILVLWGKPLAAQLLDRTTDPLYLTLFAIVSVLLVSFLLFFITNLDRSSVIGKRFPWTVEGRISKDDSQMGRLEESDSKGSS